MAPRITSVLPLVLRAASVVPSVLRNAARTYGSEATWKPPRILLPNVLPASNTSLFGLGTSFVFQIGDSVFQVLPPSVEDEQNPKTIVDGGFYDNFPKISGGLVLRAFRDGILQEFAHLSIRDYGAHLKTLGVPMLPSSDEDSDHWPRIQAGVYPSDNCGWITLFDGQGRKFLWKTTYVMRLHRLRTSSLNYKKYATHEPDGLVFEGRLTRDQMNDLRATLETHYVLDENLLGMGTESVVHKGYCIVDEHSAAVKKLKQIHHVEPIESFILKHLRLSNLIRPLRISWSEDDGSAYLALKYYIRTLADEIQMEKKFDADTGLLRFLDVVGTSKSLHDRKFLHRDINMGNYLANEKGDVLLSDLGCGELMLDGKHGTPMLNRGMSSIWCAPELTRSKAILTVKSEIYPLGIMYLLCMSEGLGSVCIDAFVKSFVQYTKGSSWRKNPLQAFLKSDFAKTFHGDPHLLVSMVSKNPNNRPSHEDIMEQIFRATKR